MDLKSFIREVPDYPKPGINFYDITTLLIDPKAFAYSIDQLAELFADSGATKIAAAEARGFIFAAPMATRMNMGFVPIRKPGKLPWKCAEVTYDLEYGTDTLCMHDDAVEKNEKVLIIDDVLATGGTMGGMIDLVQKAGGDVVGIGFLMELSFLDGPSKLRGIPHHSLLKY